MNFNNISMVKGDTLAFGIEIEGVDELENAYFSCKKNKNDNNYVFQKTLGGGIYKVANGKYGIRVDPNDTKNVEAGLYYYDLQIDINLDVYTVLIGQLEIVEEITREGNYNE